MKKSVLLPLWAALFVLCAALGFLNQPEDVTRGLLTLLSVLFFVPPFALLWQAKAEKNMHTVVLIRNLSVLSLVLTMALLVLNLLSVTGSEFLGNLLYYVLVIVSSPMVCSGYWALSLFLWACLLIVSGKMLKKKPRLILTGCPIGGVTEKVIKAAEDNGAVIVAMENCTGAKQYDRLVDENAEDIWGALAGRYLNIGCSVMTPNPNRYDLLGRLIDEYRADGVLEMTLQACHTYNVEHKSIERFCAEKRVPYFMVETDYSTADEGQLNTRIAAFIEML